MSLPIGVEPEPFELGEHLIESSGMWWALFTMVCVMVYCVID